MREGRSVKSPVGCFIPVVRIADSWALGPSSLELDLAIEHLT
jgi:hypothetical protein